MKESTIELQSLLGVTADGIIGPKTLSALAKKVGACISSDNKTIIKNIQTALGVSVDGIIGIKTLTAAINFIKVSDPDNKIVKYLNKPITYSKVNYKSQITSSTPRKSFLSGVKMSRTSPSSRHTSPCSALPGI